MVGCSLDGSDNGSEFGVLGLGSGSTAVLSFPFGDSTGGRSGTFELRAVDVRGRLGELRESGISGCTVRILS